MPKAKPAKSEPVLAPGFDPQDILENTLKAVNASVGMIFLKEPVSGCFIWGASLGLSEEFVNEFKTNPIKVGEGLTGTVALDCSLEPDVPVKVFGDAVRVKQVLFNLVGNALKEASC